jgi:hypothetical protein
MGCSSSKSALQAAPVTPTNSTADTPQVTRGDTVKSFHLHEEQTPFETGIEVNEMNGPDDNIPPNATVARAVVEDTTGNTLVGALLDTGGKGLSRTRNIGHEERGVVIAMRPTPARKRNQLAGLGSPLALGEVNRVSKFEAPQSPQEKQIKNETFFDDFDDIEEVDFDLDLDI